MNYYRDDESDQPEKPEITPHQEPGEKDKGAPQRSSLQSLTQLGQVSMPVPPKTDEHCITIIGQVEGHMVLPPQNKTTKYEHIVPQLVAVEQSPDIKGLLLVLNTVGGDVEAGLAIAEMIVSMSKPTVSLVLGGGHSIGVPIAVSAQRSFIAATATMTIHPLRLTGFLIGVPQTYEYLDKMQDRVVNFVSNNSDISEAEFRSLMFKTGDLMRDIGTVLIGQEAVDKGLITHVGGLGDARKKLRELIDEKEGSQSEGGEGY